MSFECLEAIVCKWVIGYDNFYAILGLLSSAFLPREIGWSLGQQMIVAFYALFVCHQGRGKDNQTTNVRVKRA